MKKDQKRKNADRSPSRLFGPVFLLALAAACIPSLPSPIVTRTSPPLQTVTIAPEATPTPTRTTVPKKTAKPAPTIFSGPFRRASSLAGILPDGFAEIQIRTPADGSVWLLTGLEALRWDGNAWELVLSEGEETPADVDESGRLLVVREDAVGIDVWQDGQWTTFGAESGWTPARGFIGGWWIPRSWRVYAAGDGSLWLPTDRDVRRFDGERWTGYSLADMGFPPPEWEEADLVHQIGLTAGGEVWVGECGYGGPGPTSSQGVRWFDGVLWRGAKAPVGPVCVSTVDVDEAGNVWLGAKDAIWKYDSARASWASMRLPEAMLGEFNFTYPRDLMIDGSGDIWTILQICGGGSCDAASRVFRIHAGEWSQVFESIDWYVPLKKLVLDAGGQGWAFWDGTVYRLDATGPVPAAAFPARGAGAGLDGRVWMVSGSGTDAALWVMEGSGSEGD